MSFKVQIAGMKVFNNRIRGYGQDAKLAISQELSAGALEIAAKAKRYAPVDEGFLRNSIGADIDKLLEKLVFVSAFYAPYIEFGTGSKVKIPAGYEAFAAKYKGSANRGNVQQFYYKLVQWVLRKGLVATFSVKTQRRNRINRAETDRAYELAYIIMISILKNGINPQPFLIPAFKEVEPKILKRVIRRLKEV